MMARAIDIATTTPITAPIINLLDLVGFLACCRVFSSSWGGSCIDGLFLILVEQAQFYEHHLPLKSNAVKY